MAYGILIIEDEATLAKNIKTFLTRAGYEVRAVESAEAGLDQLEAFRPEAVLLDFHLPGMTGLDAIARIQAVDRQTKIIMMTGHGNVELAVEAMKAGAYDFLTKPISLSKLKLLLEKAISEERQAETLSYYQSRDARDSGLDKLLGESEPMRALRHAVRQVIAAEEGLRDQDAPAVLITGETGTGKELVARALHFSGPRRARPFVEINCSTIPSQLLESELLGYERGAFTSADTRKLGLVETAEGGTLFLDEIGDMELALQAKLLKLLEEKTVRRLGSVRDQHVNVRIIAATHQSLESLAREGRFRSDLLFRLRIVHLRVPALRDRGQDVLLLAEHYLALHAQRYGRGPLSLSSGLRDQLCRYRWPGNVRELRNVIEQAVLMSSDPVINSVDLITSAAPPASDRDAEPRAPGPTTLEAMEREALCRALQEAAGNVSQAARALGISRDTLRYRMAKFHLSSAGSTG